MKKARLRELVGEVEEEEPEGEMVAGPSGEATTRDSGIISLLFIHIYIKKFFFSFFFFSCTHLYMLLVYIDMFSSPYILLLSPPVSLSEQINPPMRRSLLDPR